MGFATLNSNSELNLNNTFGFVFLFVFRPILSLIGHQSKYFVLYTMLTIWSYVGSSLLCAHIWSECDHSNNSSSSNGCCCCPLTHWYAGTKTRRRYRHGCITDAAMSPTTPISRCHLVQMLQSTNQLAAHTRVKEEGDEGGKWMDMKAGVTGTLTLSNHLMTTVMAAMAAATMSRICRWQRQRRRRHQQR